MRFRKFTFNWLSIMVGFHFGRNPIDGKRFLHVGLLPFIGIDFYWPSDASLLTPQGRIEQLERTLRRTIEQHHSILHSSGRPEDSWLICSEPACMGARRVLRLAILPAAVPDPPPKQAPEDAA